MTIVRPPQHVQGRSLVVLNEDRYIKLVSYRANNVTLTRDNVGTRSSAVAIRTFIKPERPF